MQNDSEKYTKLINLGTHITVPMIPINKELPSRPISDLGLQIKSSLSTQLSRYSFSLLIALYYDLFNF